ncbi:MAG: PH domain-containing protein [Chloroflexi bacterium]|nr:PH domain-containing protein [Chloroflexota bacterium]
MGIEQNRDRVVARIRQSFKQSGIDLAALTASQEDRLVNTIADNMLLEFDSMLDEVVPKQGETQKAVSGDDDTQDRHEEQVLWEGRPLLSISERYVLTSDRIRLFRGLLSRQVENVELVRLQDVDYHQGVTERLLNIGDIQLHSADASDPVVVLSNVKDPETVNALIRRAWLDARKRYGVVFREEM